MKKGQGHSFWWLVVLIIAIVCLILLIMLIGKSASGMFDIVGKLKSAFGG